MASGYAKHNPKLKAHKKRMAKKMGPQPKPTSGRDPHVAMDKARDANQAAFNKYTMKDQGKKNMGKNFKGAYGGK